MEEEHATAWTEGRSVVRIDRALIYPLEDNDWQKKLGIGAALSLIPLVGWILLMGYQMRVARNVIRGDDESMPEWDDWIGLANDGLRWVGVVVLWHVPLLALALLVVPIAAFTNFDVEDIFGNGGGSVVRWAGYAIVAAYATGVALILPAALGRTAESRSIREGVDYLGLPLVIRANLVLYSAIFLAATGAARVAGITAIIPFLGSLVVWGYLSPVIGHLYGQGYLITLRGGLPRVDDDTPYTSDEEPIDYWQAAENVVGVPGWQRRLLYAIGLAAIPIVGWVLLVGYAARVFRTIADGSIEARPEFDDWDSMVDDGWPASVVIGLWSLPFLIDISQTKWAWAWLLHGELGTRLAGFGPRDLPWDFLLYPAALGFSWGTIVDAVALVGQVLLPALVSRTIAERNIYAGFDVAGALQMMRDHPFAYATVAVIQLGVVSLVSVGFSVAYVGVAVVLGMGALLMAHLYGQLFRIVEPDYVA